MLELAFFANGTLAIAYLAISSIVLRGLHGSGQLRTNPLGLATATIFLTCGVGHGFHAAGVLEALQPGHDMAHGSTMYSWPLVAWDTLTATVGLTYLSLRKSYGVLLNRPAMFADLEREASERRVRDAEMLFRTSFDHAPIGKALVSADGTFIRVNNVLAEIVGRPAEELRGATFQEITHPDDLDADLEQVSQLLAGTIDRYAMEKRYLRPDGSHVWVMLDVAALRDDDGAFVHAIAQIQDITERRASERALAHYAELVGSSDDAIVGLDRDGRVLSWNEGARRLLGASPAEAIGRLIGQASPPADRAADEALLAKVRDGATVSHHETRRRRPDGSYVDLLLTASPVHDPDGDAVVAIAVVGHDITERLVAEQAVRDAEELFRTAFSQAPIGMALVGLDGAVRTVNEALCRSLGYEEDQLLRRKLDELTHVDDTDADRDGLRRVLDGRAESTSAERRLMHAAGHPVWVLMQTNLVRTPSGAPRHYLVQAIDITARRRFEEQLQHMADHDPLTGLLNRRSFERELERQAATAARYGTRGALLVLDLDQFKFVNDTLGHNAGDELIVATAQVLRDRMRDTDRLARLGGDEFAVILPEATRAEAAEVAESLLNCIRTAQTLRRPSGSGVSASLGVALFEPELTAQDVLVNADLAMYDAKEDGRDRYAFFEGEGFEQPRIKSRMTWIERIERAIADESFVLHAQPILDLHVGDVAMFELLVRLPGENGDVIPPATFLYIAERHDLVQAIDRWVARTAIDLIAAHRDAGRHLALSVNVSGRSLGDEALLDEIERGLRATGIPPQRLVLEITETAAVGNIHLARRFGERVHELGCRLAIDDFGAGFGSFYYLKHLPFDFLKIDGEFVQQCLDNRTDQLVVQAVVQIARGLGRETIAEFVGDERTQRFLRREGVDYSQGFHVGRPLPLDEALGLDRPPVELT